jgi:uncharacterized membrane protein
MRRLLPAALTVCALVWVALIVTAPWFVREMAVVYEFAARICHQKTERSFHMAGVQLPVCARCFGLYASGAIAAAAAWASMRGQHAALDARTARVVFAAAAAPTVVTVALEWLGLAYPSNMARAIASLPLGAAAGWVFVRMLLIEARHQAAESWRPGW